MSAIEQWVDDIGPGWRLLVRGLDTNLCDLDPDYCIGQIKEEFGGLRYYIAEFKGDADEGDRLRLVRAAEDLSFKICEDCGAPGTTKAIGGFWRKTLCPHCRQEREDELAMSQAIRSGEYKIEAVENT